MISNLATETHEKIALDSSDESSAADDRSRHKEKTDNVQDINNNFLTPNTDTKILPKSFLRSTSGMSSSTASFIFGSPQHSHKESKANTKSKVTTKETKGRSSSCIDILNLLKVFTLAFILKLSLA